MAAVLVTGASSGFGALTARALKDAGHVVYAGMRNAATRPEAAEARAYGMVPIASFRASNARNEAFMTASGGSGMRGSRILGPGTR